MSRQISKNSVICELPVRDVMIFCGQAHTWSRVKTSWKQGKDYRHNHIDHYLRCIERMEEQC